MSRGSIRRARQNRNSPRTLGRAGVFQRVGACRQALAPTKQQRAGLPFAVRFPRAADFCSSLNSNATGFASRNRPDTAFTLRFEGQPCHIAIETERVSTPEASPAKSESFAARTPPISSVAFRTAGVSPALLTSSAVTTSYKLAVACKLASQTPNSFSGGRSLPVAGFRSDKKRQRLAPTFRGAFPASSRFLRISKLDRYRPCHAKSSGL